ncbi:UBX domain-containing protein 10 [Gastrophryne carolinensis]
MASAWTGANPPGTGDPLRRMHVTRPKSAKGRTRSSAHPVEHERLSPSPAAATPRPPSARRISHEDVPELVQQFPPRPTSSSLNRYRVLPSIGSAPEELLIRQTGSMTLSARQPISTTGPAPSRNPGAEEPPLLLAVRTPCGQRFECHFLPADTLRSVLTTAEQRSGVQYRDCILESMEVPRRSFPDLGRTLRECAIPNKSVLRIHRPHRD